MTLHGKRPDPPLISPATLVSVGLIALIIIAIGVLCRCVPMRLYHAPIPPPQDNCWPTDTIHVEVIAPVSLYTLTVASQLMGVMVVDSVTHWSTVGGSLRVDRWGKPGPLYIGGEFKIVDIQERH